MSAFEKIAGFEKNLRTIESGDVGLPAGTLVDLDKAVAALPREQLALRTVAVLTGLFADLNAGMRNVSASFAGGLGGEHGTAIAKQLQDPSAVFVEPLQQLILLRRCLTKSGERGPDIWSADGLKIHFDAVRFAADVAVLGTDKASEATGAEPEDIGLTIAASFLLRLSLLNPPHFVHWVARMRLMLRQLPEQEERARPWAKRLEERLVSAFGLTFDEISRFVGMLVLWSLRFKNLSEVFKKDAGIAMNIDTWLSQTNLKREQLEKFFGRTARPTKEVLSDTALGGALSILPFRDRPFIEFADGNIAPVYPPLVAEKLTYDLFWWAATPETKQEHPWQRDWGDLVELYVVRVLESMAAATGCGFKADIRWDTKQIDAAMWFKGHVALFEISAGMVPDAAAHSGDQNKLRDALFRTFVRSESGGKPKDEAIGQIARDVKALLAGELKADIPIEPLTRAYPVVIAIDARVRVPGLRFWFDKMFSNEIEGVSDSSRVGAIAVLSLEDLETVEQLIREEHPALRGTPRGLIRLLRGWELTRDRLPKSGVRSASWYQFVREVAEAGVNERLKTEADHWWAEMKEIFKRSPAESAETADVDSIDPSR